MIVPFHCTGCSKLPPNHSSIPKISRFFIVSSGVLGLFLILSLVLPSLPPPAMITIVCLGSIFVATAIVFKIINYFVKVKRQKREEAAIQSQFGHIEKAFEKIPSDLRVVFTSVPYFDFKNSNTIIPSCATRIINDIHADFSNYKEAQCYATSLRQKYPIDKNISSMGEFMDLMNDHCLLYQKRFIPSEDNPQRYCSLASIFLVFQHIHYLNYQAHLCYMNLKIDPPRDLVKLSQNAHLAVGLAILQNDSLEKNRNDYGNDEIPFSLLFHYMTFLEKQMVTILKKIGIEC